MTATALTACATPPDLGARPELATPERYSSAQSFAAATQADWPSDRWWESYGDAELKALIEEGLADSPSLAAAAARVRRAEAAAEQTGATRYPSVSGQSQTQISRRELDADNLPSAFGGSDDWTVSGAAALQLSYQLDFFGRNRASFAAATSQAEAAQAEAAAARLQLSTAVALSYTELRRLFAERGAAEDTVRLRNDSAALVAQRVAAGLENEGQAHQANSELAQARADLAAIDGDIARRRNEIAALLGKGPDRGLAITPSTTAVAMSQGIPQNLALDLIGRRPDIVAARKNAEAAAARIDVARADFYPNVNIAAIIGFQTLGIERLTDGRVFNADFGPAISLPIFSGGRLEGAYRGARAEYDEAVALYNQTFADALRDVADALVDRRALEAQRVEARIALDAAEASYRIAHQRYQAGLTSYIDALSVENSLVTQRRNVASLEARAFTLDVALVRALGGGFAET